MKYVQTSKLANPMGMFTHEAKFTPYDDIVECALGTSAHDAEDTLRLMPLNLQRHIDEALTVRTKSTDTS